MPLTQALLHEEKFRGVAAFQVDYDNQKGFLREFGVRWQSTLIVFKGKKEVGRSLADLSKRSIRELLLKGL